MADYLRLCPVDLTQRHHNPYGINNTFKYAIDVPRSDTGYYQGRQEWLNLLDQLENTMGKPYLLGSKRPGRNRRYAVVRTLLGVIRLQFKKPSDRMFVILKNG